MKMDSRTITKKCLETGKEFELTQTKFGETWFPDIKYCDEVLEVMEKEFEEKVARKKKELKIEIGNRWIEKNIPPIYLEEINRSKNLNWDSFDKATNFKAQRSMILVGDTRRGKTRAMMEVVKTMARRGYTPIVQTAERIAINLGTAMSQNRASHQKVMDQYCKAPFLAIDDLGKENVTPRVQSDMFEMFNARFEHQRVTIITTNWVGDKLIARYPDINLARPLIERIREFCQVISF